jgi:hypothetical protein
MPGANNRRLLRRDIIRLIISCISEHVPLYFRERDCALRRYQQREILLKESETSSSPAFCRRR